ncbi:MAG: hypothetical protein HKN88_00935 [Gammaproteobacteria bacterium]|nr:hypothetical protein [Gammaproteobacteria bacterium]NNC96614.1 hypothetical protein [Gammaproteobacteria bacterium]NNM12811.1 hypothetical protein [Gammaproteobacteria bacterium]
MKYFFSTLLIALLLSGCGKTDNNTLNQDAQWYVTYVQTKYPVMTKTRSGVMFEKPEMQFELPLSLGESYSFSDKDAKRTITLAETTEAGSHFIYASQYTLDSEQNPARIDKGTFFISWRK